MGSAANRRAAGGRAESREGPMGGDGGVRRPMEARLEGEPRPPTPLAGLRPSEAPERARCGGRLGGSTLSGGVCGAFGAWPKGAR